METESLYNSTEIPDELPILPVRDVVIFPYMTLPLQIGRELSLQSVERALREHRLILMLTQKNAQVDEPEPEDLYSIGTVGMTGYANGYHLHWELRINNIAVDPFQWTQKEFWA